MNIKERVNMEEGFENIICKLQAYEMDLKLRQPAGSQVAAGSALLSSMGVSSSSGSLMMPAPTAIVATPTAVATSTVAASSSASTITPETASQIEKVAEIAKILDRLKMTPEYVALFTSVLSCFDALQSGKIATPTLNMNELNQVHPEDMEEAEIKCLLASGAYKAQRFMQRTGKTDFVLKPNEKLGYDKSVMRCYNYHVPGHFARECPQPKSNVSNLVNHFNRASKSSGSPSTPSSQQRQGGSAHGAETTPTTETSQAIVVTECRGYNWYNTMEGPDSQVALMAQLNEAASSPIPMLMGICQADVDLVKAQVADDVSISLCSPSCLETVARYRTHNIDLIKNANIWENKVNEYKKLEKTFQTQVRILQDDIRIATLKINEKDMLLCNAERRVEEAKIETTRVQASLEKFVASQAIMDELNSRSRHPGTSGQGFHAVPPPFNNNHFVMPTIKKSHELELDNNDDESTTLCNLHRITRERPSVYHAQVKVEQSLDVSTIEVDEYYELAPVVETPSVGSSLANKHVADEHVKDKSSSVKEEESVEVVEEETCSDDSEDERESVRLHENVLKSSCVKTKTISKSAKCQSSQKQNVCIKAAFTNSMDECNDLSVRAKSVVEKYKAPIGKVKRKDVNQKQNTRILNKGKGFSVINGFPQSQLDSKLMKDKTALTNKIGKSIEQANQSLHSRFVPAGAKPENIARKEVKHPSRAPVRRKSVQPPIQSSSPRTSHYSSGSSCSMRSISKIVCFTCGGGGHTKQVCSSDPKDELVKKVKVCTFCRDKGHRYYACPLLDKSKKKAKNESQNSVKSTTLPNKPNFYGSSTDILDSVKQKDDRDYRVELPMTNLSPVVHHEEALSSDSESEYEDSTNALSEDSVTETEEESVTVTAEKECSEQVNEPEVAATQIPVGTTSTEAAAGPGIDLIVDLPELNISNLNETMAADAHPISRTNKMGNLKYVDIHNQVAYLETTDPAYEEFHPLLTNLKKSRIFKAISENPKLVEKQLKSWWNTTYMVPATENTEEHIIGKVSGKDVKVLESIIRKVLDFKDTATDPITFSPRLIERCFQMMKYQGRFPTLFRGQFPYHWRYLSHVLLLCLSSRKAGTDTLNASYASMMVALITNKPYNFSKIIYMGMKENLIKSSEHKFLQFPRFIQLIIKDQQPELPVEGPTTYAKSMTKQTLELQRAAKSNKKYVYEDGFVYTYFGFFAGDTAFTLAEEGEAVNVQDEEAAAEPEVQLEKKRKRVSKPKSVKMHTPAVTEEVLTEALNQAVMQAGLEKSVKDLSQKSVIIEERSEEPSSTPFPAPDFEKKKGKVDVVSEPESSSTSEESRRIFEQRRFEKVKQAEKELRKKSEKEKDKAFDPNEEEATESDDDPSYYKIQKRKATGLLKKTGGTQEPLLKKPKTSHGPPKASLSKPWVPDTSEQTKIIDNLTKRLRSVEADNARKTKQIIDLRQSNNQLQKSMIGLTRMVRRLSKKVDGDGDDNDDHDDDKKDGGGKKDNGGDGGEGDVSGENKDVSKGAEGDAEGGASVDSTPEAESGKKANEGVKQTPTGDVSQTPKNAPGSSEAGPSTTTHKGLFIDISKPPKALFGGDESVGAGESDDFNLEKLYEDIDDTEVLSRAQYVDLDGTPIQGIEISPNVDVGPSQKGASSSGVDVGESSHEQPAKSDAPFAPHYASYRKMTRKEKYIFFKHKVSDYLDMQISAYAIFDEEIPCLPYGLTQKQKDAFMGKHAEWFKPQQHEKPVLDDLMKVNLKARNYVRQWRKGRKITVKKDESPIIAWWWDGVQKAFGVKRESGLIDYFNTIISMMNSLPEFELRKLARLELQNPTNQDRANAAMRVLIKAVHDNFQGYNLVQGVRKVRKGDMHPTSGKPWEYVEYPVPQALTQVKVQYHQPLGSLSDLMGWRYDGKGHFAVLEFTDGRNVMMFEPMDLTAYHKEDLIKLSKMQIRTTLEYEWHGKSFHEIVINSIEKADPVTGYVLRSPPIQKD
ncbi:hypothetical protein L1987_57236 [Smallanthus sonchifolius]|uniref:Uncharacterized protein n=1 Tax=Smallanthus sonchifolius TaxID=185202 RepID=A0ACB9DCI8_9ASTR|nr:hypothetical protein L1987_57236 [Smallanthus sonchifolius]